jgi:hypothetical protein
MRRKVAALLIPALAALGLAGCAQTPAAQNSPPTSYAPYDYETNPYCGVFGTCEPAITRPYPIPSNH